MNTICAAEATHKPYRWAKTPDMLSGTHSLGDGLGAVDDSNAYLTGGGIDPIAAVVYLCIQLLNDLITRGYSLAFRVTAGFGRLNEICRR